MADRQPTRPSKRLDSAEPPASVDRAELNDQLSTIEQHCQLFDNMLNASKPGETPHSDREALKVTIDPLSHNNFGHRQGICISCARVLLGLLLLLLLLLLIGPQFDVS